MGEILVGEIPEADVLEKVAAEWLEARDIIAKALEDMGAHNCEHNAAAIIARLASAGIVLGKVPV